jgi:hypothetical protein
MQIDRGFGRRRRGKLVFVISNNTNIVATLGKGKRQTTGIIPNPAGIGGIFTCEKRNTHRSYSAVQQRSLMLILRDRVMI